ncbi:MAG: glycosyltransferase family 2 protein [Pirellulaceae bacterium]|jgi:glycosyltransferase involved in cell wall biosynthesis|nr:glycosyltransferase family 2 protein [Pirellulaceae bacterium]
MDVSIVVPIYNEYENLPLLYEQLVGVLDTLERGCEVLLVDDGSTDGSEARLRELARRDDRVKVVRFRRNYGQTAALQAGLQLAEGDVIVTMDGDLQNDPRDIHMMLDKIDQGYDLVHGWRKDRQDAWLNRRLPSQLANWLISRVTRFPIHDLGCTLKAIRRDIAQELELYGEMHRFIPILAHARGARCLEVVTRHHARQHGQTKYGISRTIRVVLDLITVKYLLSYFASPMKLFGAVGLATTLLALLALAGTVGMKIFRSVDMTGNPLLLLAACGMVAAIQFFSLGLLGEVSARIYFRGADRQHYAVRELLNFESAHTTARFPEARRAA